MEDIILKVIEHSIVAGLAGFCIYIQHKHNQGTADRQFQALQELTREVRDLIDEIKGIIVNRGQ